MTNYLHGLLMQQEPLEEHEIDDLKNWLDTLIQDCSTFGPTRDDERRMREIKAKIGDNQ